MVKPFNTHPPLGRFSISPNRWNRFRNSRMLVVATPNLPGQVELVDEGPRPRVVAQHPLHEALLDLRRRRRGLGLRDSAGPPGLTAAPAAVRLPAMIPWACRLASTLRTVVRLTPSRALSAFSDGRLAPTSSAADQVERIVERSLEYRVRLHSRPNRKLSWTFNP